MNIRTTGQQSQAIQGLSLGGSHSNWGNRHAQRLLSGRYW